MIRVLCVQPDPRDATSFYRAMGPIGYMRHLTSEFEFVGLPTNFNVTWSTLQQADVFYCQRPFSESHKSLCEMALENGLKLWIDYDDDIFNIPIHNHVRAIYEKKNARKWAQECLEMADFVTVSTEGLYNLLGKNKKVYVVPNAINEKIFKLEEKKEQSKIIMWRGSKTHEIDMEEVHDDLVYLASKNKKWRFVFIGEHSWRTVDRLRGFKNVTFFEAKDVIQYHRALKKLNPDINIAPLQDIVFNHSKSMCSYLEANYAGAVTVGRDWTEWQRPGIYNYENGKFKDAVSDLIEDQEMVKTMHQQGMQYIKQNLTLAQTCRKRINLIKSVL